MCRYTLTRAGTISQPLTTCAVRDPSKRLQFPEGGTIHPPLNIVQQAGAGTVSMLALLAAITLTATEPCAHCAILDLCPEGFTCSDAFNSSACPAGFACPVGSCAETHAPGPLHCAYGEDVSASCVLYVPEAQGSLPLGPTHEVRAR